MAKGKLRENMLVVFRIWRSGLVRFGKIVGFNQHDQWQDGAPIVEASDDDRHYVVETAHQSELKRGTIRPATESDIKWFGGERAAARAKRKAIEAAGYSSYPDLNSPEPVRVQPPDLDIRVRPRRGTDPSTGSGLDVGQAAADVVEKEIKKEVNKK